MRLLDVSANTTGASFFIDDGERHFPKIVQVDITGTATVTVQGRTYPDMQWITIATYTSSGADAVQLFPEMRAVASGMTSATVKVELDARKRIGT